MGTRRRSRELALQLLYQNELTDTSPEEMQLGFDEWQNAGSGVREFADTLLRGTLAKLGEIDAELVRQTTHWRLERLAAVDRNILRLAMYELIYRVRYTARGGDRRSHRDSEEVRLERFRPFRQRSPGWFCKTESRGRMRATVLGLGLLVALPVFSEEARYLVTGSVPVPAAANGYQQVVREGGGGEYEVHVVTTLAPIESAGTYGRVLAGGSPKVPGGFELPKRLSDVLTPDLGAWEAATAVLEWVSAHVAVDTGDGGPQDAVSVLDRGRGRCSGLANAAVALLNASGFEARTVSGLLVGDEEAIPHRWIECRLPAAGWVPSDPTLGLWAVTPRHMVFADTVTENPRVEILESSEDGLQRLPRQGGRLVRPNLGADLVCRLPSPASPPVPVAVLRGTSGEERRARLDPEAEFSGLLPGRWVLEIEAGGEIIERRSFMLRSGGFHSFTVTGLETHQPGTPAS